MECIVKGIPIYYEERGTGQPLLMLHGWPSDHHYMLYHMEPCFDQRSQWRRIYLDLPGMGKTPGADWITSQDDMLAVTLAFLDAVAPDERFTVAGASYGGYLARGIAYQRSSQINGILLTEPTVEIDQATRNLPPHQILVHDPAFVASLAADEQMVLQVAVVQNRDFLTAFRAAVKPGITSADFAFLKRLEAKFAFSFDVDSLAAPIPAPTLILTGRQDSMTGYRGAFALLDNFPRGTYAVLDRAGHGLNVEQKPLFRAFVNEWLDRVEEFVANSGGIS